MRTIPAKGSDDDATRQRLSYAPSRRAPAIVSHPIFTTALMGWSAVVLGAVVMILPAAMIAQATSLVGLGLIGELSRFIFAVVAAVIGGGIGLTLAKLIRGQDAREDHDYAEFEEAGRDGVAREPYDLRADMQLDPIDPAKDLGSESFDAPIEAAEYEELGARAAQKQAPAPAQPAKSDRNPAPGRRRAIGKLVQQEAALENDASPLVTPEPTPKGSQSEPIQHAPIIEEDTPEFDPLMGAAAESDLPEAPTMPAPKSAQSALDRLIEASAPSGASSDETSDMEANEVEPEAHCDTPVTLDLEEFGALETRDGVWVEGPQDAETPQETAPVEAAKPEVRAPENSQRRANPAVPTALAKLRATPVHDLNMLQMMERFAAALEERKATAAFAKALKYADCEPPAQMAPNQQEIKAAANRESDKLRNALDKLGELRGAA